MNSPARAFHPRNALTYIALVLGLAAVACALDGQPASAGALISAAVLADTFDGRFARLFGSGDARAQFGSQIDSLCDACTFGMAPVICTVALTLPGHLQGLVWVAGCWYLIAALTRLAFYNVTHDRVPGFVGLPAPVAALIWCSALCVTGRPEVLAAVLLAAGVAMIAPWRLPRPTGAALGLFAAWPILVMTRHLVSR